MSLEALTGLDQLGLPQQGRGGIKRKEREMATEAGAIAVVAWRGLLGEGPGWPCGSVYCLVLEPGGRGWNGDGGHGSATRALGAAAESRAKGVHPLQIGRAHV